MTEIQELTAAELLASDGEVVTVADLIRQLGTFPPDLPVVVSIDGPDPGVCSPVDWSDAMGYYPDSPYHGSVIDWDPADDDDPDGNPGVVKALVIGQRGLPDEARPPRGGDPQS
jgi:hypothetical protein